MSPTLLAPLAGLALLDSTSIGTLFIPVWLLMAPDRVRVARILVYLGTIALFYFGVGLLLVVGGGWLVDALDGALDQRPVRWAQLVLGVGLFAWSFRFDGKRRKQSSGVRRWRDRAAAGDSSAGWLIGLALLAALAEVATMLPYLGAIGMLTTADLAAWTVVVLLVGYCVVMVLPAGALLVARVAVPSRIEPLLHRMNAWIEKHSSSATGWVLGIAGFLIAQDAIGRLF